MKAAKGPTMVFKVQQSLGGTMGRALIYDESREVMFEHVLTPTLKKLLGGRRKAYFEGRLVDGIIELEGDREVEDPGW